ncbi:MAG: hypothetical protein JKY34_05860 [Kordiimonadaceae bacterium]|nr:hypothetical protein [Kordiimonadaceae bacterium]
MKTGRLLLVFLLLAGFGLSISTQGQARQTSWTEEKLGKYAVKAERAATKKRWSRAIKCGEKMLVGSLALYPKKDIEYIRRLKTLNRYYDKAGKLDQIPERVKEAYLLSKEQLAPLHDSSKTSRLLYYKLLIAQKSYREAIHIVQENIALVGPSEDEQFRLYHYLKQLYSLYGLTGQLPQEEQTLLTFLALDKRLVGSPAEEQIQIIILLAQNYCLQKKLGKFRELSNSYGLQYRC